MFTGIIEEIGTVVSISQSSEQSRITIKAKNVFSDLKLGDSVAVNGVCLTVSSIIMNTFTADIMNETFSRTSLSKLRKKSYVNLERAMPANGRFGGHIVTGHVDGIGTITAVEKDDNAIWYSISAKSDIMNYIIEKGSIAIDGISLTVARIKDNTFSVSIIPHTAKETILSEKSVGDIVNLENDVVGKYVAKLMGTKQENTANSNITTDFLAQNGFM